MYKRQEYNSLQKLMQAEVIGEADMQREDFLGALAGMHRQAVTDRRQDLSTRFATLDDTEKAELRVLMADYAAQGKAAAE